MSDECTSDLQKKTTFPDGWMGWRVIYLMGRRGHMHKVGIGSGGTADVRVLSFCSFMPSSIDCPLSSSLLCLLVCRRRRTWRKEGRHHLAGYLYSIPLFLYWRHQAEEETFSVPISTCLLSVFPSGRTEYQSEAAPNNQGLRHNLVFRHAIPWERRKIGFGG